VVLVDMVVDVVEVVDVDVAGVVDVVFLDGVAVAVVVVVTVVELTVGVNRVVVSKQSAGHPPGCWHLQSQLL